MTTWELMLSHLSPCSRTEVVPALLPTPPQALLRSGPPGALFLRTASTQPLSVFHLLCHKCSFPVSLAPGALLPLQLPQWGRWEEKTIILKLKTKTLKGTSVSHYPKIAPLAFCRVLLAPATVFIRAHILLHTCAHLHRKMWMDCFCREGFVNPNQRVPFGRPPSVLRLPFFLAGTCSMKLFPKPTVTYL